MALTEHFGNVFDAIEQHQHGPKILAHGVNSLGAMAGGIARQIAIRYPEVEADYMRVCERIRIDQGDPLGVMWPSRAGDFFIIAHLFTQLMPGPDARLEAVKKAIDTLFLFADETNSTIFTVRIGCGIGGLDWEKDVKPVFTSYALVYPDVDCQVWEFRQ